MRTREESDMSRTRKIVVVAIVGIAMVMTLAIPARAPLADFGCTPGFWKKQLDLWVGYGPGDPFDDTFGVVSSFTGKTLFEALRLGGGGEKAAMRHAVAALLNAAHPGVAFTLSEAEVIAAVQDAYATGNFEEAKCRSSKGCGQIRYEIKRGFLPSVYPFSSLHAILKEQLCLLQLPTHLWSFPFLSLPA